MRHLDDAKCLRLQLPPHLVTAPGPQLWSVLLLLFNLRERHFPPVKQAMVLAHFRDGDPREMQGRGTDLAWVPGSALLHVRGKRNMDFIHAESRGQHLQLPGVICCF